MHDGCSLAGSLWLHRLLSNVHAGRYPLTHPGPVLPGACAKEEKKKVKKEKREAVGSPARPASGLQAAPLSHTRIGVPGSVDKGAERMRVPGFLGCFLGGRGTFLEAKNSATFPASSFAPLSRQPKIASVNLQQFEWPWTGVPAHRLTEIQLNFDPRPPLPPACKPRLPDQEACVTPLVARHTSYWGDPRLLIACS